MKPKIRNKIEVKLERPERNFVKVYIDFLTNETLTAEEKMVYIAMKSFVNFSENSGTIYPTMDALCKRCSMAEPRVRKNINKLVEKNLVIKHRRGRTKSNIYILRDTMDVWPPEKEKQEVNQDELSNVPTREILKELRKRGYTMIEKEPEIVPAKKQSQAQSKIDNQTFHSQNTALTTKSQGCNKYSMQDIKEKLDYDLLIQDYPHDTDMINGIFELLYDTINSDQPTLRVKKTDMPAQEVKARLKNLTRYEIERVIQTFNDKPDKIFSTDAYILTLLYTAGRQLNADLQNRINSNRTIT